MPFAVYAKAIIPKKALDVPKVQQELGGVMKTYGRYGTREYNKTVAAWTGDRPSFTHLAWRYGGSLYLWIGPYGNADAVTKWRRLDEETVGEHTFGPRNAPYLRFRWQGPGVSYKAATRKRWFGSTRRQKYGPVSRFSRVKHPGHEAREWSIALGEKLIGPFTRDVQDAVNRGITP